MASSSTLSPRASARRLYRWGSIALAAIVFGGFARTYYLKTFFQLPPLPALVHVHSVVMTLWVLTFLTQVRLVAKRRVDLHRRVGAAGAVLAVLVLVTGVLTGIEAARNGNSPGPPPLVFLVVPIVDITVFAILCGLGLAFRRRSEIHRRLMLLASLGILTPAFARPILLAGLAPVAPLIAFGLTDLVILACIIYDTRVHGRLHPAFGYGGALVIASHPFRLWFGGTAAWLAIAQWLTA
jgi:uncharacterized membrane protein YozB (DUF420 family)